MKNASAFDASVANADDDGNDEVDLIELLTDVAEQDDLFNVECFVGECTGDEKNQYLTKHADHLDEEAIKEGKVEVRYVKWLYYNSKKWTTQECHMKYGGNLNNATWTTLEAAWQDLNSDQREALSKKYVP